MPPKDCKESSESKLSPKKGSRSKEGAVEEEQATARDRGKVGDDENTKKKLVEKEAVGNTEVSGQEEKRKMDEDVGAGAGTAIGSLGGTSPSIAAIGSAQKKDINKEGAASILPPNVIHPSPKALEVNDKGKR